MKSIIKNLLVVIILISAVNTSFSNNYPTIKLIENKTLAVNLNDWSNQDVTITIQDFYGTVLHIDQLNQVDIKSRRYNLKYLPDGNYNLIIEGTTKKATHSIKVIEGKLKVSDDIKMVFKPVVAVKNGNLEFNQLTLGRAISVSIADANGTFFTKEFEAASTINKRFDISALPIGRYTLIVEGEDQYDTYAFTK